MTRGRRRTMDSILPCVRCGDPDGVTGNRGVPLRRDGNVFGFAGELCLSCYNIVRYYPNAAVKSHHWRDRLVDAVTGFLAALDADDVTEQMVQLTRMRQLAETIRGIIAAEAHRDVWSVGEE